MASSELERGMNVVLGDLIYADEVAFSLPATPLSRGYTHGSMEENFKALFAEMGLELVTYDQVQRMQVGLRVDITARGKGWQDRLSR